MDAGTKTRSEKVSRHSFDSIRLIIAAQTGRAGMVGEDFPIGGGEIRVSGGWLIPDKGIIILIPHYTTVLPLHFFLSSR
jgi:hypothetical protein